MATLLMTSHHAFRRDLIRFAIALADLDRSRIEALRAEWQGYRAALHGHHQIEDANIFPGLRAMPDLTVAIDELSAQHERIGPLLTRGDGAFAVLPDSQEAVLVIAELGALLDQHLDLEEATIIQHLRAAKEFPPPASEEELTLYADGFAWSTHGIAPEVIAKVNVMLPEGLVARLPAARAAFDARCIRAWGSAHAGAAHTSHPSF